MKMRFIQLTSFIIAMTILITLLASCDVAFDSVTLPPETDAPETIAAPVTTKAETTKAQTTKVETTAEETTAEEVRTQGLVISVDKTAYAEQTKTPKVINKINTSPTTVCISGSCERGSTIIVRGGPDDVSFEADGIYFLGTFEVYPSGSTDVVVTAKADGKSESEGVVVHARYNKSAVQLRDDAYEVVVGLDSQGHLISSIPDYEGTNLLVDGQISGLAKNVSDRVKWLSENTSGAEIIYLIVPSSTVLFPETVPAKYTASKQTTSRKEQFTKAVVAGGATVIDATDALISHKSDPVKLFHKTDSHWTEYGAWIAYTELFSYISQRFPAAAPRAFEDMGFYTKDVDGGDMPFYLEFDCADCREVAVFASPVIPMPTTTLKFRTADTLLMNHETTPASATIKNTVSENYTELPTAYVYRDSYCIALYDMLAERFSVTDYRGMWDYSFDKSAIKSANPDYVLYIIAERNLGELLY
ncbi:MAG: hypothetical protein WCQ72_07370 [Eubacteriales bacterium]